MSTSNPAKHTLLRKPRRSSRAQGAPAFGRGRLLSLLVVAALGTSWSSYQATRWNGEQAKAASRTNAIRIDAARAQGLSQAQSQVDVATFIAWADAKEINVPWFGKLLYHVFPFRRGVVLANLRRVFGETLPESGTRMPERIFTVVDFPAPFGPM